MVVLPHELAENMSLVSELEYQPIVYLKEQSKAMNRTVTSTQ